MVSPHQLNLAIHVGMGTAAMAVGFYLVARAKGTPAHRKAGRLFVALTLAVCASAVAGNVLFRFVPLFAILTVLVLYQLLSGWHVIYTKAAGPDAVDALLTAGAALSTILLLPHLASAGAASASVVVYSSVGAVVALIVYDSARWIFPRRWHAALWRYEHIYKLLASLFAMLSAAAGNLVRSGQPWSQLGPTVLGAIVIAWFFRRNYRAHAGISATRTIAA